jgi:hypothetical protein
MSRIARLWIVGIALMSALGASTIVAAQKVPDPPAAPIPAQILTAKKIFIANGDSDPVFGVSNLAYNEFYASVKDSAQYELVPAPAGADLVCEVRYEIVFPGATHLQLRLAIIDPQTGIVLWRFTEHVRPWDREATGRKNFSTAISALVADLKTSSAPRPAATVVIAPH